MRSEDLRRAVSTLPCADCGIEGYSQAAHSNLYEHGKGRGMKADDRFIFPLCCDRPGVRGCHTKHDQLIGVTAGKAEENTRRWIIWTYAQLVEREILKIDQRKIPKP